MPPVLIAAGVTAAASIGGAVLSSSSARKSANQAADTSAANTASNNALARDIYGQNRDILNPYVQRGNEAGNAINALLGLGSGAPAPQAPQQAQSWGGPVNALYGAPMGSGGGFQSRFGLDTPLGEDFGGGEYFANGQPVTYGNQQYGQPQPVPGAMPGAVTTPAPQAAGGYQDAFKNFLNSTGFQFQMDQGNKATNQGYAARGMLQSGAALKALQDRGQQTALNNYFMPYMGLLGQQQGIGLSGASAVAGVGQNYAGSVMANNNMGTQTALDAISARNAANQQMYGGVGNALGNFAGAAFGSSYGGGRSMQNDVRGMMLRNPGVF